MKIKNLVGIIFIILSVFFIAYACNKSENQPQISDEQNATVTEDINDTQALEDLMEEVLQELEKFDLLKSATEPACPVRTNVKPDSAAFPRIITKDYGDSCVNRFGAVRSGKIIIKLSGPWLVKGTERVLTFDNYTVNGTLIEGSQTYSYMGETNEGYFWHKLKGELKLTRPDKKIVSREIHEDIYMISGMKTTEPEDNEWLIDGNFKVTRPDSVQYTVQIEKPLHRLYTCKWFVSGVKRIQVEDVKIFVDFGDETCDSFITRTVGDDEPEIIDLNKKN